MAGPKMRKLSTGIYRDRYSIRAIVNIAAGRQEKRFDHDTPLAEIKRWRNETKVKIETKHPQRKAGMMGRGTFAADVKRYLKTLAIASWKSRRSELRAWERHFGTVKRRRVSADHVRTAIKAWVDAGVPPKTIQNRVRALTALYHGLDGPDAWTPADGVPFPKPRRKLPGYVPPETIIDVEKNLRALEKAGEIEPAWRARFMVLAACGARPVHVMLTEPKDVDLKRGIWRITGAKDGNPIPFPLNSDQAAAWKQFVKVGAWGDFDTTKGARILRAAGWPEGVDPYTAKHSFGQDLADAGIDRGTIADLYGHTDDNTTKFYVPRSKLARANQAIDGRLGWGTKKKRSVDVVGRRNAETPTKLQIRQALDVLRRAAQAG